MYRIGIKIRIKFIVYSSSTEIKCDGQETKGNKFWTFLEIDPFFRYDFSKRTMPVNFVKLVAAVIGEAFVNGAGI